MADLGIATTFMRFGTEILSLNQHGFLGIIILAIFGGMWAISYQILSKGGKKESVLSKWLPPIMALFFTIYISIDSSTMNFKSATDFLKMFESFVWFAVSSGLGVWLIGIGLKSEKKGAWGRIPMWTCLLIGSSLLMSNFSTEIVKAHAVATGGKVTTTYLMQKFGEYQAFSTIGSLLALVMGISTIGLLGSVIGTLTVGGYKGATVAAKWRNEVTEERREVYNDYNKSLNNIENSIKAVRDIYTKLSAVYKTQDEQRVRGSETKNNLNLMKLHSETIIKNLKKVSEINGEALSGKLAWLLTIEGRSTSYFNELQNNVSSLETHLKQLIEEINKYDGDNSTNPFSEVYNILNSWANFAKGYNEIVKVFGKELEHIKERIDESEQVNTAFEKTLSRADNLISHKEEFRSLIVKKFSECIGNKFKNNYNIVEFRKLDLIANVVLDFFETHKEEDDKNNVIDPYAVFRTIKGANANAFEYLYNTVLLPYVKDLSDGEMNSSVNLTSIKESMRSNLESLYEAQKIAYLNSRRDTSSEEASESSSAVKQKLDQERQYFESLDKLKNNLITIYMGLAKDENKNLENAKTIVKASPNIIKNIQNNINKIKDLDDSIFTMDEFKDKSTLYSKIRNDINDINRVLKRLVAEYQQIVKMQNYNEDSVFKMVADLQNLANLIEQLNTDANHSILLKALLDNN